MNERSVVVVSAGVTQPSSSRLLADRLAAASVAALRDRGVASRVRTVEIREHAQDLASNVLTGFPSPLLREATDAVLEADALIAVTPVYNASYAGLFKVFFDVLERDSLVGMPVLVGATGGTPRHSLVLDHALRPLFAYLGAAVVPTGVYAAAEDWGSGGSGADAGLVERIERAGRDLANAVVARVPRQVADPFAEPVPFEELLAGGEPGRARD
jgi:FMN reductase